MDAQHTAASFCNPFCQTFSFHAVLFRYQDAIADGQAERGKADAEVALCEERDAMMQVTTLHF